MFPELPGHWTPVLPLTALTGNPMAVELAGTRLALFRDVTGRWHALVDRCPHRAAALSLGAVQPDGTLQCRYHGWRFAGDGRCTRIPLNEVDDRALARVRATACATRELAGALWVFTAALDPDQAAPEPALPDSLRGPPREYGIYCQEWSTHWTRAVENFVDFAHPSYLHRDTIGTYSHHHAESGAVARVEVRETPWGASTLNSFGRRGTGFQVDWYRPNLSVLHFGGGPAGQLHVFSVPVNAGRTRVMTVRRLQPGADPVAFAARAGTVDHTILDEDRVVVESQPGPVGPDEIPVATDAFSVAFRRWYRMLMKKP